MVGEPLQEHVMNSIMRMPTFDSGYRGCRSVSAAVEC